MSAAKHAAERKAELRNRFAGLIANSSTDDADATPAASEPQPKEAAPPARRTRRKTPRGAPTQAKPAKRVQQRAQPAEPMPISQSSADTARPKRLMVPLSVDEDQALKRARLGDGIPAAARVRAMLALYRSDERVARKVDATAKQMR